MSKWCGDENCLQCADKEPDPCVHLPREDYNAIRDERDRLREALQGILDIGKRDMTNPKYDGYFEAAEAALAPAGEDGGATK